MVPIAKHDLNDQYLNCRKNQIVSFLQSRGVKVEGLFYRAYEKPGDIFEALYFSAMDRNLYLDRVIQDRDLNLLDIFPQRVTKQSFSEGMPAINEMLNRYGAVLLFGDGYYLPYKRNTYLVRNEFHSVMLTNISANGAGTGYTVVDDVYEGVNYMSGKDYSSYSVSAEQLAQFYDHYTTEGNETTDSKWDLLSLDVSGHRFSKPYLKERLYPLFGELVREFEDDFSLYEQVPLFVKENAKTDNLAKDPLLQALTITLGSRAHVLKFLKHAELCPAVWDSIDQTIGLLESVRYTIAKKNMTGKLDNAKLISKCEKLIAEENFTLRELKAYVGIMV